MRFADWRDINETDKDKFSVQRADRSQGEPQSLYKVNVQVSGDTHLLYDSINADGSNIQIHLEFILQILHPRINRTKFGCESDHLYMYIVSCTLWWVNEQL